MHSDEKFLDSIMLLTRLIIIGLNLLTGVNI
jgi:hypothetical protein